jgi:drug/metabolite transporter (DMT)-like permease
LPLSAGERHHIALGVFYALATSAVGSSAAAVVKYLGSELSGWLIVWIQYALCTLIMLPWLVRRGPRVLHTRHPWQHLVRALGGWLGFTCYYLALPVIPLVDASLLRAAAPLWVPLVVWLAFRQQVPALRWVALATGFAGVVMILRPDTGTVQLGHLLGLAAGLALAISMSYTRSLSRSEPAPRVLFYYFSIATVASTPMAITHWQPVPLALWPALLFTGGSIYLTMVLYTRAYSLAPTSLVAPLGYVAVPLAALFDWLFWDQLPRGTVVAGSALVIASGVLAVTLGARQRSEH